MQQAMTQGTDCKKSLLLPSEPTAKFLLEYDERLDIVDLNTANLSIQISLWENKCVHNQLQQPSNTINTGSYTGCLKTSP